VDNLNQWKHGFSVKAINSELGKRGHNARLEKANGYSYFKGGEPDRINRRQSDTFGPGRSRQGGCDPARGGRRRIARATPLFIRS